MMTVIVIQSFMGRIATFLAVFAILMGQVFATWSIVVVNTRTGEVAVASITCVEGINLRSWTPVILPGVGAAAAQNMLDRSGNRLLIHDLMLEGMAPDDIIFALASHDTAHNTRQYGIVDLQARTAYFNGTSAGDYYGARSGKIGELVYSIQGNVLAGAPVLDEAESTLILTPGDLSEKLIAAMEAAAIMGGDGRCSCTTGQAASCGSPPPGPFKSGHVGFMLIARMGEEALPCVQSGCAKGDFYCELNQRDLMAADADPILLLRQDYDNWRAGLQGRVDAIQSVVHGPANNRIEASTAGTEIYLLELSDIDGNILTTGGSLITLAHLSGSTGNATLQSVTDHNDGTYTLEVEPGNQPGIESFSFQVDDGTRPVLLWPAQTLTLTPALIEPQLAAGQLAEFTVWGAGTASNTTFAYSLTGTGPTATPYGLVDLSPPIFLLPSVTADPLTGDASLPVNVPAGAFGMSVSLQAGVIGALGQVVLTNAHALIVQ